MNITFAKTVFTIGGIAGITLPLYAYYWKITTMEGLNDGIRKDSKRLEKLGKTRDDIPKNVFLGTEIREPIRDANLESEAKKMRKQKLFDERL